MVLTGIVLTGCQRNEPQMQKKTIDLKVNKSEWVFDNNLGFYYCQFDVPELTSNVYNYGEVSVSREYNSGTADMYQRPLPLTDYKREQLVDSAGKPIDEYVNYQEHIEYLHGPGFVEIDLTISDFIYDGFVPDAMLFRLQLTY